MAPKFKWRLQTTLPSHVGPPKLLYLLFLLHSPFAFPHGSTTRTYLAWEISPDQLAVTEDRYVSTCETPVGCTIFAVFWSVCHLNKHEKSVWWENKDLCLFSLYYPTSVLTPLQTSSQPFFRQQKLLQVSASFWHLVLLLLRPNPLKTFCWVFWEGGEAFEGPMMEDGEIPAERFLGNS